MKRKPLKRHPNLIPLSHAHHKGLLLAQLLKADTPDYRGMPTEKANIILYAQREYQERLLPHFTQEEEQLMPLIENRTKELSAFSQRVLEEHHQLREGFSALQPDSDALTLDRLGKLLERHIRFEERQWFMAIQKELTEKELAKLKL